MRKIIRGVIIICVVALSVDAFLSVADYFGAWEWWHGAVEAHPFLQSIVRGPTFPLLCLGVVVLVIAGDKYLKQPYIVAVYTNVKIIPDLHNVTMKTMMDEEQKNPGWDLHDLKWYWLVELKMVNESEHAVTIDEEEAILRIGANKWIRKVPFIRKQQKMISVSSTSEFQASPNWSNLESLLDKIKDKPLTRGVKYRGWLGFEVVANRRDINNSEIDIWLIDALENRHQLIYRKDDKKWAKFDVVKDV